MAHEDRRQQHRGKKVGIDRSRRRRVRRQGEGASPLGGGEGAARQAPRRHARRPSRAARSAAAARSRTSRRGPATPARARSAPPTGSAAARSSARKPRDYDYTRAEEGQAGALRSALSLRAKEKKLVVVDELRRSTRRRPSGGRQRSRSSASRSALMVDGKENANLVEVGAQPAEVEVPRARRRSTSTTSSTTPTLDR